MNQGTKLIIGLGNPDEKYYQTYHNVGHLLIDFLSSKPKADNHQLLKSPVYMNKSGQFVKEELRKRKLKPENLLIIHDDSDLFLGSYKLSFGRGSAGNKGVQDIINQLKTQDFWRLRIGIRDPKEKTRTKADKLVLKKITNTHKKTLEATYQEINKQLSD